VRQSLNLSPRQSKLRKRGDTLYRFCPLAFLIEMRHDCRKWSR
jgi:hypothetical protein